MSALGHKQTLFIAIPMSALPPKADMLERMSPDNMTTALDCFDALPSQQAKAIWRALAGG